MVELRVTVHDLKPGRASGIAFNTSRVRNVPSECKNNIEERDQCSQKKIKEATKKRLADYNLQGEGRCTTLTSNAELRWSLIEWERNEKGMLTGRRPRGKRSPVR
jgi:hypothetical protein